MGTWHQADQIGSESPRYILDPTDPRDFGGQSEALHSHSENQFMLIDVARLDKTNFVAENHYSIRLTSKTTATRTWIPIRNDEAVFFFVPLLQSTVVLSMIRTAPKDGHEAELDDRCRTRHEVGLTSFCSPLSDQDLPVRRTGISVEPFRQ